MQQHQKKLSKDLSHFTLLNSFNYHINIRKRFSTHGYARQFYKINAKDSTNTRNISFLGFKREAREELLIFFINPLIKLFYPRESFSTFFLYLWRKNYLWKIVQQKNNQNYDHLSLIYLHRGNDMFFAKCA